jgi:predicted ATPase
VITQIEIEGFKSLQHVKLKLGHFNLFVGTNASGKSNFFDALRFLQGLGYGFTIEEIFNGKPKSANSEVWERIRGGSSYADFIGNNRAHTTGGESLIRFNIELQLDSASERTIRYEIDVSAKLGSVRREKLSLNGSEIFDSTPLTNLSNSPVIEAKYYPGGKGRSPHLKFEKSRPILQQLLRNDDCKREHREIIKLCLQALTNTQRIDPSPAMLREYSQTQLIRRMGERGENFAALVNAIASNEKARSAYVSWLKELTPTEVEDVKVLEGALGEPFFALTERNQDYPAPILSDGTLRFAAIAAAFFQPDMPDLLTIEEIENGIHPTRLRLLVELLKSQAKQNIQVIATTHSPIVLAWLKKEDYATTFFCNRDEQTGASVIKPLDQIPRFLKLVSKQPISDLLMKETLQNYNGLLQRCPELAELEKRIRLLLMKS